MHQIFFNSIDPTLSNNCCYCTQIAEQKTRAGTYFANMYAYMISCMCLHTCIHTYIHTKSVAAYLLYIIYSLDWQTRPHNYSHLSKAQSSQLPRNNSIFPPEVHVKHMVHDHRCASHSGHRLTVEEVYATGMWLYNSNTEHHMRLSSKTLTTKLNKYQCMYLGGV